MRRVEQSYAEPSRLQLRYPDDPRQDRGCRTRAHRDRRGMDWRERFALVGARPCDASFVASGPTLEELFRDASERLLRSTVERADRIRDRVASEVTLVEDELDFLLPRLLNGLVYLRERGLLLRARRVRLDVSERIRLDCRLAGEIFDPGRHKLVREVRRVTTCPLRSPRGERAWEALVTLHE